MNAARWCALGAIALWMSGAGVTACVGSSDDSSSQDGGNKDASADGTLPLDSSSPDFSISATPTSVLVDPGGATVAVTVNVTRLNGFAEPINLTLTGAPADVTGSGTVVGTATTAVFNISAGGAASVGQTASATITAISGNTNVTHTAALFVRVGHVLLITDQSTTWTVPADVSDVNVLAWGAGGGGASGGNLNVPGGAGGPGGFIQSSFHVNAGDSLSVIVGSPGAGASVTGSTNNYVVNAGAGGGYSALAAATDAGADGANYYLVVGAGGGGYTYSGSISNGGYGGGGDGGNASGVNFGTGKGASETAGGASNGAFLQGGQVSPGVNGGNPGGGSASGTYSGGGGGYYGGGTGSGNSGGGGGSGYVRSDGTSTLLDIGSGTAAPQTSNPYYVAPVAIGGVGGNAAVGGINPFPPTAGSPGGHGRIVILVAP